MKNILFAIPILVILNSCATIYNTKNTNITISSTGKPFSVKLYMDTEKWYTTPHVFEVERSKSDLLLKVKNDSLAKIINIRSKLSPVFWFGNLLNGILPFGYLIDLSNNNRFTYPDKFAINIYDTSKKIIRIYSTKLEPEKKLVRFTFSIPEGNHFKIFTGKNYANSFGFLGLSGNVDYFVTSNTFLSTNIGTITDFIMPFPAPFTHFGDYKRSFANFIDIEIKKEIKKINVGLGLQYTKSKFFEIKTTSIPPSNKSIVKYSKSQSNFGLLFSSYYRIIRGFDFGFKYLPSFVNWDNNTSNADYTHLLFLDLKFNIELYRPRKTFSNINLHQ